MVDAGESILPEMAVSFLIPICAAIGIVFAVLMWRRVGAISMGRAPYRAQNGREYLLEEEQRGDDEVRLLEWPAASWKLRRCCCVRGVCHRWRINRGHICSGTFSWPAPPLPRGCCSSVAFHAGRISRHKPDTSKTRAAGCRRALRAAPGRSSPASRCTSVAASPVLAASASRGGGTVDLRMLCTAPDSEFPCSLRAGRPEGGRDPDCHQRGREFVPVHDLQAHGHLHGAFRGAGVM